MDLMLAPLRRYAEFEGRSRRSEYWLFALFQILLYIAMAVVGGGAASLLSSAGSEDLAGVVAAVLMVAFVIVMLGLFIPSLAVTVRRLHDAGFSGWWVLLSLIPLGGLVVFIFTVLDGTPGPNQYGADPKGRGDEPIRPSDAVVSA